MLTTGREIDRMFIVVLIVCLVVLGSYTCYSFKTINSTYNTAVDAFDKRLTYMTSQIESAQKALHEEVKNEEETVLEEVKPEPLPYGS